MTKLLKIQGNINDTKNDITDDYKLNEIYSKVTKIQNEIDIIKNDKRGINIRLDELEQSSVSRKEMQDLASEMGIAMSSLEEKGIIGIDKRLHNIENNIMKKEEINKIQNNLETKIKNIKDLAKESSELASNAEEACSKLAEDMLIRQEQNLNNNNTTDK